jgi:hypothetical protein
MQAKELVVLGYGQARHIEQLQKLLPNLPLTVVDPRIKPTDIQSLSGCQTLQYVTSLEGVEVLRIQLEQTSIPTPILCYRPCWYPYKIFFDWAYDTLIDRASLDSRKKSQASFIIESLFK